MSEQLDPETFTGAHPTAAEFVARLEAWGFRGRPVKRRRGQRGHDVHEVFRGPHGGTVRVLRSRAGRADPDVVAKAAHLARVDVRQFWAGPDAAPTTPTATPAAEAVPDPGAAPDTAPATAPDIAAMASAGSAPASDVAPEAVAQAGGRRRACGGPSRDQITSLVLAAHTSTDRPLGFDQVVQICHGRITRDQVRTASATLCRDGHLDRIRSAVYQWSGGHRATVVPPLASPAPSAVPRPRDRPVRDMAPRSAAATPAPAAAATSVSSASVSSASGPSAAELFELLFPRGVQMTAELLEDFERWSELTAKLSAHAERRAS